MSITARRIVASIEITGQTQSVTTESIMGRIDQLLISSTSRISFDLTLTNMYGEIIWKKEGLNIDTEYEGLMPKVLPLGIVVVTISNPVPASGTVNISFVEKERGS